MSKELEGKVAVITGGVTGIGRESVRVFLEEGAKVVIGDIAVEGGNAYAAELGDNARFLKCDVSQAADVEALVEFAVSSFGKLDIMFNNAGVSGDMGQKYFFDDDFSEFSRVMSIDLLGVMLGCRIAGKYMAKQGSGSIINTASTGGCYPGYGIPVYRAAKAGVISLTENAAIILGKFGVRVNAISPGAIETGMAFSGMDIPAEKQQAMIRDVMEVLLEAQPIKRFGKTKDIANSAVFLGSDRSEFITGQNLIVAGGMGVGDNVNRLEVLNAVIQKAMAADS